MITKSQLERLNTALHPNGIRAVIEPHGVTLGGTHVGAEVTLIWFHSSAHPGQVVENAYLDLMLSNPTEEHIKFIVHDVLAALSVQNVHSNRN